MPKFFEKYSKVYGETEEGIPGLEMNAAVVNNTAIRGDIGIEFELEGRNLLTGGDLDGIIGRETTTIWNSKEDGSLRNGGREYVLSGPCKVTELDDLIMPFFKKFDERARTEIQNSNRCSTHVHININGFKINELTSVLGLWMAMETPLINWCGEERMKNHFCLSSNDEEGVAEAWSTYLRTGKHPYGNRGLKYSALNILPIWNFGSLEFRCGAAADEPLMPLTWAKFLYHFVHYAKETYPNPEQIAYDLSERGAEDILNEIIARTGDLPIPFYNEVTEPYDGNFNVTCIEGFRNAQPFIMSYPWDDWLKIINRPYVPNPFGKKATKVKIARPMGGRIGFEGLRDHDRDGVPEAPRFRG